MIKILFFGDINGKSGRKAIAKVLPDLRKQYQPDLVMANAENLAHGKGVTLKTFSELFDLGVEFFTSGNHVFDKPEVQAVFQKYPDKIIRPANFKGLLPDGSPLPGKGYVLMQVGKVPVMVINLNGQAFMENQFDYGKIENPFLVLNKILEEASEKAAVKILDFHAEATSEKRAMGFWADGRVSAVLGSHTHVPTNDAQILPLGTGYLSDLGMVGAANSVIGVTKESALRRFKTEAEEAKKSPLEIDEREDFEIGFVVLEIDEKSGKCQNIEGKVLSVK